MAFSLQGFIDNSIPTIKAAWLNAVDTMYALGRRTNAGTPITLANSQWQVTDSANNYSSIDINNQSAGTSASSDFVATANTGTDTTQFVNMGINGSAYSVAGWTVNGALDAYVYASDGNMAIGTAAAKRLDFFVGGTLAANVAMTISSSGIASLTTAPTGTDNTTKIATTSFAVPKGLLTTAGDIIYATGASTPARLGIGTALQVLRTNAGATAPEWATVSTGGITLGTPVAATSGTAIDFTGIPSSVKRVTISLNGVSTSGSSNLQIQIGPVGGIETTTYVAGCGYNSTNAGSAAGFLINNSLAAASVQNGSIVLVLENSLTNTWCSNGILYDSTSPTIFKSAGVKAIAGVLSKVRITTAAGTDTFDLGEINIQYE